MHIYLSEADARQLASFDLAVESLVAAFKDLDAGGAINTVRQRVLSDGCEMNTMTATLCRPRVVGTRCYTVGADGMQSTTHLAFSDSDGMTAAVSSAYLGLLRTGAATAIATDHLSRPDSACLGIIGAGRQSMMQIEAVLRVRDIDEIRIWSRSAAAAQRLAALAQLNFGVMAIPMTGAESVVNVADILVTVTSSPTPVIRRQWVRAGTHINAIGSNSLSRIEIPHGLVRACDHIVVDSVEQSRFEAGDLAALQLCDRGGMEKFTEVSRLVADPTNGRRNDTEITLFESLGVAIEDVAIAAEVVQRYTQTHPSADGNRMRSPKSSNLVALRESR